MFSLYKKELNTFFGSITGYLVIAVFLITSSLFLWILPGNFNIIENQRATLNGLFEIAPWLYLFLIPAITMRMFAEEKRTGTIEMLITRPITTTGIIGAKYLASLTLVAISLAPTLIYFWSVSQLGAPSGNIDSGATWGSFIGLFFLASAYIAIGLFASSLTTNQLISFLTAIVLSYIFYLGFNYIANTNLPFNIQSLFLKLGINEHYISLSRGVIDSRDLVYFFLFTFIFLQFTRLTLVKQHYKSKNTFSILFIIIVSIILVGHRVFRIDLSDGKRYSLTSVSKQVIKKQDNVITADIYLTGDLPPAMKQFQKDIVAKIEDISAYSSKRIFSQLFDVYEITSEKERNNTINQLLELGLEPVNLGHKTNEGLSTKQIFPGIVFSNGEKNIAVNLLKNNPMLTSDENLQQSVELLEFEIIRAFRMLQSDTKPTVAFLTGHNEADEYETGDIRYSLSGTYNVTTTTSQELATNDSIDILIIADPNDRFPESDKLMIDQFLMKGGKILWCVDPVFASIDSLSRGYSTIAFERDLNLRDQLFKYGIRLNSDILQDAVCMEYPVNTAPPGKPTQWVPAPFYYSILASPSPAHPLSRNLNNVMLEFPGSLDMVGENENRKTTVIITTSPYARRIQTPVEVSLLSATNPPDKRLFNQSNIPIGILVEGSFESVFQNRLTEQMGIGPDELIRNTANNKMIVIADGGIIKNKVRIRNDQMQIQPLGYDYYSGQTFGNRDFIMNCIDYLSDDSGIMELRSRVVKLRLLDKVKIRDEKTKWQFINTTIPLVFFLLFGIIFTVARKKRNTKRK
jgi:ABC-2 type transport system permease protein